MRELKIPRTGELERAMLLVVLRIFRAISCMVPTLVRLFLPDLVIKHQTPLVTSKARAARHDGILYTEAVGRAAGAPGVRLVVLLVECDDVCEGRLDGIHSLRLLLLLCVLRIVEEWRSGSQCARGVVFVNGRHQHLQV